jgi:hypothetical protein
MPTRHAHPPELRDHAGAWLHQLGPDAIPGGRPAAPPKRERLQAICACRRRGCAGGPMSGRRGRWSPMPIGRPARPPTQGDPRVRSPHPRQRPLPPSPGRPGRPAPRRRRAGRQGSTTVWVPWPGWRVIGAEQADPGDLGAWRGGRQPGRHVRLVRVA